MGHPLRINRMWLCYLPSTIPRAPRSLRSLFPRAIYSLRRFAPCFDIRPALILPFYSSGPIPSSTIASLCLRCRPLRNEGTIAMTNTEKYSISNKAINMHSRGPTEQHFYVWEPHRGYLHKVKKVSWCPLIKEGQLSHKYAIASSVEPMNLLSKGSNESLPKY